MERIHLTKIDSVRGLAATFVALVHLIGVTILPHAAVSSASIFDLHEARDIAVSLVAVAISGYIAVTLFFLISGLVLGLALDRRSGSSMQRYLDFLISRCFRLYPAHVVAVGAAVCLGWLSVHVAPPVDLSPYHVIEPADFADWVNGRIFDPVRLKSLIGNLSLGTWSMNLIGWTLYVEICAAPLLPLFHRLSRIDSAYVDAVAFAALVALAIGLWDVVAVKYWFIFYAGMTIQTRGREWARFVAEKLRSPGLVAAVCYALMMVAELLSHGRPPVTVLVETVAGFSLLSLIVWRGETKAFAVLEHPVLRFAGRVSYSFYLWQFIILRLWTRVLYGTFSPQFMTHYEVLVCIATAIVTVGAAFAVARFSYAFVERPGIALGAAVVSRLRRAAARGLPTVEQAERPDAYSAAPTDALR